MATLLEKCNNIKNDKDTNLKPENLKAGVTCLGVTGTLTELDTSDATATSSDIAFGKTAYVNGKKIEGLVYEVPAGSSLTLEGSGAEDLPNQSKLLVTCPSEADVFFKQNSSADIATSYNKIANAIGLTSDKLIKGNTVLGIEGTAETEVRTNVKLFKSVEEMNNDEDKQVGDIGLVYTMGGPLDLNTEFSTLKIPKSVTLATEITESLEFNFVSKDPDWRVENWSPCRLDSAYFEMSLMLYSETQGMMKHIMVEFHNDNGIYSDSGNTQGDITEDENYFYIELPCTIGFSEDTVWNDAFGKFMINTTAALEGLYAIESLENGYQLAPTQLTATSEKLLPGSVAYGKGGVIIGDGSYIANISSTDYMATFLPGVTINRPLSGSAILNNADEVNGGTLVTYEQISTSEAFNSENYISTDAILAKPTYTGGPDETRTAVAKITGGYNSSSSSKKMYTHIYNGVPYAVWIGCTLARTDSYPYLTALDAAIMDMTNGTLYKTISFSGSLKLSSYTGYASGECGLTYDFENDCVRGLYCSSTAANPAKVSMFNISNLGEGSIIEYAINCGVSTSMYSNDNTYWDYKNKCFYVLIGPGLYSKYMVKLSIDGTYTLIDTLELGAYIHPDVFGDTHDNGPIIALYENEGSLYNYALYNCETQAKLKLTKIGIGSYGFVDGDEYFYIVEKTAEGIGKAAKVKKDTMELIYLTNIPDVNCPAGNQPGHAIMFADDKVSFVVDRTMYDLEGNILGYTPSTLRGEGGITQKVTFDDIHTYLNWMNPGSQYGISNSKPTYSYHKVGNITTTPITQNIGVVMGSSTALTNKTNMIPLTNF